MLNQKRESFRVDLRKIANEKLFKQSRKIIQSNSMETSEAQFFNMLEEFLQEAFNVPKLLGILKCCEDNFDKQRFLRLMLDQQDMQVCVLQNVINRFSATEEYIELLIHLFLHLTPDNSKVLQIVHQNSLIQRLLELISLEHINTRVPQLVVFVFGELMQYSKMLKIGIKNMDIINRVLQIITKVGISNVTTDFFECFNFVVWSLITPDLNGVESTMQEIFPLLLELSVSIQNFTSQFLLSVIFKCATYIGSCQVEFLEFQQLPLLLKQLKNGISSQIVLDFIGLLSRLLINDYTILHQLWIVDEKRVMKLIIGWIGGEQQLGDEIKIQSIYFLEELFRQPDILNDLIANKIHTIMCSAVLNTHNYELITAYFNAFTTLVTISKDDQLLNSDVLIDAIQHGVTFDSNIQIATVWQFILYAISEFNELSSLIIHKLKIRNFKVLIEQILIKENNVILITLLTQVMERIQ